MHSITFTLREKFFDAVEKQGLDAPELTILKTLFDELGIKPEPIADPDRPVGRFGINLPSLETARQMASILMEYDEVHTFAVQPGAFKAK